MRMSTIYIFKIWTTKPNTAPPFTFNKFFPFSPFPSKSEEKRFSAAEMAEGEIKNTTIDPESEFLASKRTNGNEWETFKENVRPLKRGRNVNLLNHALKSHTHTHLKKSLLQHRRFILSLSLSLSLSLTRTLLRSLSDLFFISLLSFFQQETHRSHRRIPGRWPSPPLATVSICIPLTFLFTFFISTTKKLVNYQLYHLIF